MRSFCNLCFIRAVGKLWGLPDLKHMITQQAVGYCSIYKEMSDLFKLVLLLHNKTFILDFDLHTFLLHVCKLWVAIAMTVQYWIVDMGVLQQCLQWNHFLDGLPWHLYHLLCKTAAMCSRASWILSWNQRRKFSSRSSINPLSESSCDRLSSPGDHLPLLACKTTFLRYSYMCKEFWNTYLFDG